MLSLKKALTDIANKFQSFSNYIINSGTTSKTGIEWKWEKWASGKVTCYGYYGNTATPSTGKKTVTVYLPFTFPSADYHIVATPGINASVLDPSSWWGVCDGNANPKKTTSYFQMTYTAKSAYTPYFYIYVTYLP